MASNSANESAGHPDALPMFQMSDSVRLVGGEMNQGNV